VRAAGQTLTRALRLALLVLAALAVLLGTSGAHADESQTEQLEAAGDALAAKSRSAVLELYALESRLGSVQGRLAELRTQSEEVARERASAERHLAVVRSSLAVAESRLAERIRQLYTEDNPDPIAVLLGAESLDAAIATLDNLGRFARQDRRIVAQVKAARRDVKRALGKLAKREAELAALTQETAASEAALLAARSEQQGYLARLREEQRMNVAQLASLQTSVQAAEERSDDLEADAGESAPEPAPASVPDAPAEPGMQLTVLATGYALNGTTATGIPVGWGVVAVDPSVIPLGTRMTIPGYGEGVAADTGGAVHGNVIDLWFPTTAQALAWGRRTVTITLH
jgi:3D (Asp-Asp-Asp) domain-containing protein/septal ring factor EnvC (AmiA/AmiB activator)